MDTKKRNLGLVKKREQQRDTETLCLGVQLHPGRMRKVTSRVEREGFAKEEGAPRRGRRGWKKWSGLGV